VSGLPAAADMTAKQRRAWAALLGRLDGREWALLVAAMGWPEPSSQVQEALAADLRQTMADRSQ
jgi:hypothetical protein